MDFGKHFSIFSSIKLIVFSLFLILLFQCFFYHKDLFYVYAFNKIFFTCFVIVIFYLYLVQKYKTNEIKNINKSLILLFLYLLLQSIITTKIYFAQPIYMAITSQVKLVGIFYFFAVLFILDKFKIKMDTFEKAILYIGLGSLILFLLASVCLKFNIIEHFRFIFLKYSLAKGYYLKYPCVIFCKLILFYFIISSYKHKENKVKNFLLVLSILLILTYFYKQRIYLFLTYISCFLIMLYYSSRKTKVYFAFGIFVFLTVFIILFLSNNGYFSIKKPSMLLRINTIKIIFNQLWEHPFAILFGFGNLSYDNAVNWHSKYGKDFFLSDVGIFGLVFEFGLIGAFVILYTLYKLTINNIKINIKNYTMLNAINFYIIFALLFIPVTPFIYGCGKIFAMFGIINHFNRKFRI